MNFPLIKIVNKTVIVCIVYLIFFFLYFLFFRVHTYWRGRYMETFQVTGIALAYFLSMVLTETCNAKFKLHAIITPFVLHYQLVCEMSNSWNLFLRIHCFILSFPDLLLCTFSPVTEKFKVYSNWESVSESNWSWINLYKLKIKIIN